MTLVDIFIAETYSYVTKSKLNITPEYRMNSLCFKYVNVSIVVPRSAYICIYIYTVSIDYERQHHSILIRG